MFSFGISDLVESICSEMSIYSKNKIDRLLDCIRKGMTNEAASLLRKLKNSCILDNDVRCQLWHLSVKYSNVEIVQLLIELGCNINARDGDGNTPLILAVKKQDSTIVEVLLKNNADIHLADRDGMSSLRLAAQGRLIASTFIPLKHNSHFIFEMFVDKMNKDFSTSQRKVTSVLLDACNLVKLAAVAFGSAELARFMLVNGYPIDYRAPERNFTALHWATIMGKRENAKLLIDHGVMSILKDRYGPSPLCYYTYNLEREDEQSEILKTLIKVGWTDSNGRDRKMVEREVEDLLIRGNKATVKTVLASGIDVGSIKFTDGRSLLHLFVANQNTDVFELFSELDLNVEVDAASGKGTALTIAIRHGCLKKVEFLLKHGADVNLISSGYDASPLFCACRGIYAATEEGARDAVKIVELLLERGADAQFVLNLGDYQQTIVDRVRVAHRGKPLTEVIIAHLALLEARDRSLLTDLTRRKIQSNPQMNTDFYSCTQQLEEMKEIKVYENVTVFKLLNESRRKVTAYVRNEQFLEAFNCKVQRMLHLKPYYLNTLERKISYAREKIDLDEKAALVIEKLTGLCSDVYHVIIYKIISYMDDHCLNILCQAESACL